MKYWITFQMLLFTLCLVVLLPVLVLIAVSGYGDSIPDRIIFAINRFLDDIYEHGGLTEEQYKDIKDELNSH